MIYGDKELKLWWQNLSLYQKDHLIETLEGVGSDFGASIAAQYARQKPGPSRSPEFSVKQLNSLKNFYDKM